MEEHCMICNRIIPDGGHVCICCAESKRNKTNRDRITGMSIYDLLMRLNKYRRVHCVMVGLYDSTTRSKRRCIRYDGNCATCIADWLNEEAKT